jgi:hypothetical protein
MLQIYDTVNLLFNPWNPHGLFMLFCLPKADGGFIIELFLIFMQLYVAGKEATGPVTLFF